MSLERENPMADQVDELLNRLKAQPLDHELDRLEAGVWSRIDRRRGADIFGGRALQVQVAVTCGALLLGLAIAQFAGMGAMPEPLSSEMIVLSDDSALAPSVRLEGGT